MIGATSAAALLAGVGEDEIDDLEIVIPDFDQPVVVGRRAVAVLYEGSDGQLYEHRFRNQGAILVVDDGALLILDDTLTLSDLGIED